MRVTSLLLGLLSLIIAWAGPLPDLATGSFPAHMIMHMLVVAIAAPLLAFGLKESVFDPSHRMKSFFSPIISSVGELIVVWAWHTPFLHHFARHMSWGLVLEQGSFLFVGLWFWCSVLSPDQRGGGIMGLLLTAMHMTLLGALIGLSPRSLFLHHSVEEQQLGGAIMLVVGGVVYLTGGLYLTMKLLRSKRTYENHA